MRNFLAILLMTGVVGNAAAASWTVVYTDPKFTMYINKEDVWRSGGTAKMWAMVDYATPLPSLNPEGSYLPSTFLSSVSLHEYDCVERKFHLLQGAAYEDHMGEGRQAWQIKGPREWEYVKPGSTVEIHLKAACKK